MHENNPFQNIKDYWGSYYSTITEGSLKGLLNDMGYFFTDEGQHKGKWVHEKTGKALSDKHAMDIAYERFSRKKKRKKETDAAGPNPTDKDARKQGEESTHSEEVEHDGEQLDELSKATYGSYIEKAAKDMQDRAYDATPIKGDEQHAKIAKRVKGIGRAVKALSKEESLFHKDSDRLLREHIRAEYEARGIYPTSREVQETYNMVMDLIEKRKSYEQRTASLMLRRGASGKEVKDTVGRKRTPEGKSGNAILRKAREDAELQGIMQSHFRDDNDEPLVPRIQDHLARRVKRPNPRTEREVGLNIKGSDGLSKGISLGLKTLSPEERQNAVTSISDENPDIRIPAKQRIFKKGKATLPTASPDPGSSPSSPARKQSQAEVDTRFLMGQGFSPSHLRRIMSDTGR